MTDETKQYYVYVYIDPRNFDEFYYGKGKGTRKNNHLDDDKDSDKVRRIKAIQHEGLQPIIKVIARGLTEHEAFLVEKTLIWKLGKNLTNKSSGHFAEQFRPHDTLHRNLSGFDFENGLYFFNTGEDKHAFRDWDDCRKYSFLSAGQHDKYSKQIRTLELGDIVAAYLNGHGYVGIGRITSKAVRVNDFKFKGKQLDQLKLASKNIFKNANNDKSEYLVEVNWIKTVDRKSAKWSKNVGLFTTQLIKASLHNQPLTVEYLEQTFGVNFQELLT